MTDGELVTPAARAGLVLGGRYELLHHLATGGMAQVWEATDQVLHRRVAAKVLHPHLATDRGFLIRFQREAIAAARLSHSSIVSIYDTVASDGYEAIIMELIEGRTLREVLDDVGRVSHADAKDIGLQVSEALDEAHQGGVVHRDIKPSNILLCSDRRVMVTDFGIAKAGEDADITAVGTLLGTAKYLSPEQVSGDDVDPRSDLYALGVVLFECLAGMAPFQADTDAATALARLHQPQPRISSINTSVSPEFDNLVYRLMEREPGNRFQSAREARTALSGIRLDQPVSTDVVDPTMAESAPWTSPPESETAGTEVADEQDDEIGFARSGRSWMAPALLLVILGSALLLAGVLLKRTPIASVVRSPTTAVASESVDTTTLTRVEEISDEPVIVGLSSVDPPPGDGSEGDLRLALAVDGDNDTYWHTETYHRPNFGDLKSGVGVLLTLKSRSIVEKVKIDSPTDGWSMKVFVGDDFAGTPDSWGEPVAIVTNEDNSKSIDTDGAIGSLVLLWITDHGISEDDEGPQYRFELGEVEVS